MHVSAESAPKYTLASLRPNAKVWGKGNNGSQTKPRFIFGTNLLKPLRTLSLLTFQPLMLLQKCNGCPTIMPCFVVRLGAGRARRD